MTIAHEERTETSSGSRDRANQPSRISLARPMRRVVVATAPACNSRRYRELVKPQHSEPIQAIGGVVTLDASSSYRCSLRDRPSNNNTRSASNS